MWGLGSTLSFLINKRYGYSCTLEDMAATFPSPPTGYFPYFDEILKRIRKRAIQFGGMSFISPSSPILHFDDKIDQKFQDLIYVSFNYLNFNSFKLNIFSNAIIFFHQCESKANIF
jgi:hypothetical protein